ncbi:uncharacterized protein TRIREDRAFT_108605 [Trichoderma reesei QM6a]|uniref:Predicted protein n=2 Tax=Hypocrea jecorina TaxID=51453 RepID=G0RM44_HYPJQ|nr:uncharacterized protein TRIREDRAFT_108605 [Trichoderma reesei QM6a]EGR47712.1 predicted protein [Trichoderma reesei QM6a]ETS01089.1 hypothetical protein M419DRAFT_81358 [Trichoderma reesei RUT C-30]
MNSFSPKSIRPDFLKSKNRGSAIPSLTSAAEKATGPEAFRDHDVTAAFGDACKEQNMHRSYPVLRYGTQRGTVLNRPIASPGSGVSSAAQQQQQQPQHSQSKKKNPRTESRAAGGTKYISSLFSCCSLLFPETRRRPTTHPPWPPLWVQIDQLILPAGWIAEAVSVLPRGKTPKFLDCIPRRETWRGEHEDAQGQTPAHAPPLLSARFHRLLVPSRGDAKRDLVPDSSAQKAIKFPSPSERSSYEYFVLAKGACVKRGRRRRREAKSHASPPCPSRRLDALQRNFAMYK